MPPGFIGTRGKRNDIQDRPSPNFDMGMNDKGNNILPELFEIPTKKQDFPPGFIAVRGRRQDVPPGFVAVRGKRQVDPGFIAVRGRRDDIFPGFVAVRGKKQNVDPGFIASRGRRQYVDPGFIAGRGRRNGGKSISVDPGFIAGRGKRNDDSTDFMAIREPRQDVIDPGFIAVRGKRNIDMPSDVNVIKNRKIHSSNSMIIHGKIQDKQPTFVEIRKKRSAPLEFIENQAKSEYLFDIPLILLSERYDLVDDLNGNSETDFSKRFDNFPPGFIAVRGKRKSEFTYENMTNGDLIDCTKAQVALCRWFVATKG
ncbi:uncharacterized protein LOC111640874 [Centruroides sculpturatus]|uniref:uncharacterized protein LOC111640874 n=1 Tax=Centruroides sculpturatus TaxID=218467 RepID=UPI000C6E7B98|nr:uncharacterized protein LOC111640874 [Centruroides sculpturatus]